MYNLFFSVENCNVFTCVLLPATLQKNIANLGLKLNMNPAKGLLGAKGFSCVPSAWGCEAYKETGSVVVSPSATSEAAILV